MSTTFSRASIRATVSLISFAVVLISSSAWDKSSSLLLLLLLFCVMSVRDDEGESGTESLSRKREI